MNDIIDNFQVSEDCIVESLTSNLKGNLKAIIIDADLPSEVYIVSAENQDLRILDVNNIVGNKYFMIRKPCVDKEGNRFNYACEAISLNESLIVRIKSRSGNNVRIVFRMEE